MDQIVLKNVTKTFTTKTLGTVTAVDKLNLTIKEGECFSFLGPSGCGKTTTLRMIAGFEDLTEGEIHLCGRPVSMKDKNLYVPPEERGLGMVFQSFAVWPHLNIFENVAFPLKVRKVPKDEMMQRVEKALKHTSLEGMEKVFPGSLSGGQQQRIALARAIVTNPKVMLLDEPLSNLDPKLRETMRFEIKELQKEFNFTIVFVTHDQAEAMALSDRMMVMDMGRIIQVGTPTELYNKPINQFVHKFLGQSTFTQVDIRGGKAYPKGDAEHALPVDVPPDAEPHMIMATRPNQIDMNRTAGYPSQVIKRSFLTNHAEYLVKVGEAVIKVQTPHRNEFEQGESCFLRFPGAMWYAPDSEALEAERNRRQLV